MRPRAGSQLPAVFAVALLVAMAAVACRGGGTNNKAATRATAPTATSVDPAARYLALANRANEAADRFNTAAARLQTRTVTQAQLATEAATFATALDDMNKGLATGVWPPKVAALVPDLIAANKKVIADLQRTGTVPAPELVAWNHQLALDEGAFTEVATRIRLALRLPPAEA